MYDTQAPFVAAFVILRRDDDKIAFLLRENTAWMNGYYGLPSGKVEKNESFASGAIREGLEEVGVNIARENLKYIHTMHRHGDDMDWVDVYFEVLEWEGDVINAEPHMHSKIAWFAQKNLPDNVIPPVRAALDVILQGEQYSEYGWS